MDLGFLGWVVLVLHLIFSLAIIIIVLMQSGKSAGLSGSIAGGAETFYGKNKGRSIDGVLKKLTAVIAVGFLITSILMYMICVGTLDM